MNARQKKIRRRAYYEMGREAIYVTASAAAIGGLMLLILFIYALLSLR